MIQLLNKKMPVATRKRVFDPKESAKRFVRNPRFSASEAQLELATRMLKEQERRGQGGKRMSIDEAMELAEEHLRAARAEM